MIVRDLLTRWKIVVDDKTLNKLDRQIRQTKRNFRDAGKEAIRFGKNLSVFVTLPLLGLGAVLVKTASDAEEGASKFGTVFESIRNEANQTAEDLKNSFGLSRAESKALLADTGDLLVGFGFTEKSALKLSNEVQQLAVDLASFTNFSGGADGASRALTKALLGERESIKSLGISILEEDVKARVLLNTTRGLTFETKRQAKAAATLMLAQEQSKKAIGDFARTNQQFANRLRIMRARINDLAVSFGQILLPPALRLVNAVTSLVEFLDTLDPSVKTIILSVLGVAAALGPALIAFGLLAKVLVLAKGGFQIARIAMTKFSLAGVLSFLAFIAVIAAVFLVLEDLLAFFQGRKSVTAVMVDAFNRAIDAINAKFKTFPDIFKQAVTGALLPLRLLINTIQGIGGALGALSQGDFGGAKAALAEIITKSFDFDFDDVGAALGFDVSERTFRLPQAQPSLTAPSGAGSVVNTNTININSPITVPEGTPPELVGNKVKEGVEAAMDKQLRDALNTVQPAVAF